MRRPKRENLISAAIDLVDEEGAGSLTMRSLAARVELRVSSLYNHVSGRADLIEAIRARIVSQIETGYFATMTWDHALGAWGQSYLQSFSAHPNVIPLLATTPIRDESTLEMYETVIAALVRQGWSTASAVAVMRTVEAHVLGSALDIAAPNDLLAQASVPAHLKALRDALDPEFATSTGADHAFRIGLQALIDGLRIRHDRGAA